MCNSVMPKVQGLAGFLDHLPDAQLETVRIALFPREGAEPAAQDAVVRVVEIPVDDVAGPPAHLALLRQAGNRPEGMQIPALEQPQRIGLGNPLAGGGLVVEVPQLAALDKEVHGIYYQNHGHWAIIDTGELS